MMRKLIGLFIAVLLGINVTPGQNPDMPVIVPPSPELASLAKTGSADVGMNTGTAQLNIPLYELTVGAIKLPISISYSTNGVKVNDIASRVGLGWNLVAGGSVTHTVRDEDDLDPNTVKLAPPSSFSTHNQALVNYLETAGFDTKDTENDEFGFSVNGISGKFFIDENGTPRIIAQNGIRLQKNGNTFTLITGKGIKYHFGINNQVEKTHGYSLNGVGRWEKANTTGWFLTKIESPQGDTIIFNYSDVLIKTLQGPSQTAKIGSNEPPAPYCGPCQTQWGYPQQNRVDYDTKYLTSIVTNNGQQVYFIYENRADTSGDKRLTKVMVYADQGAGVTSQIKSYQFEYNNYPINADWNHRFYLSKLYTQSTTIDPLTSQPEETLVHQFEYNDPGGLPSQWSYNQDHFGYANGANNTTNFIADYPASIYQQTNGPLANRNPNFAYAKKGSLDKIIYPNGGHERFNYGANRVAVWKTDSTYGSAKSLSGKGTVLRGDVTFTNSFTTNSVPTFKIHHVTFNTPSGPYPGEFHYWEPDGLHEMSKVEIIKIATGVVVYQNTHKNYANYTATVLSALEPNTEYFLKLTVWGTSVTATVDIDYAIITNSYWLNEERCGIRVEKIEAYDPVTRITNKKFYTYASINDLTKSSGYGAISPLYSSPYPDVMTCEQEQVQTQVGCAKAQLSSGSVMGDYTFGGTPIAYTTVIEADDSLMKNGVTQHHFSGDIPYLQSAVILGVSVPGASSSMQSNIGSGTEIATEWLKKTGAGLVTLKQQYNTYSFHPGTSYNQTNYLIRKRYGLFSSATPSEKVLGYDAGQYIYSSGWMHLDSIVVTEFDEDGQNPKRTYTAYEYNNAQHAQPSKVISNASDGTTEEVLNKYPVDFATSPFTGMVTKNILTPVIESKTKKGTTWTGTSQTDYSSWPANNPFYKPSVVKAAKGADNAEARIRYYSYNDKGNATELSKENGSHISYLWNHYNTLPVAEVKNAELADIAYTSFEGNDKGQWIFDEANISSSSSITGKKSFSGTITRNLNSAKYSVVTAWAQGAITLNGYTPTVLATKQGWNLCYWKFNGFSLITIDANQVDELRLYPEGAMMTTYTYLPFIGVSSINDQDNFIQYYEYDGFNRLLLVRNTDLDIVKQYEYKYNQTINPCFNTTADWLLTGRKRCVTSGPNNNYTGAQEAEERDQNNCSDTYLQTRWVPVQSVNQCQPIPRCTGASKRVVNGQCEEGTKVILSSQKVGSVWHCTYKYVWSDGYESAPVTETSSTSCYGEIEL